MCNWGCLLITLSYPFKELPITLLDGYLYQVPLGNDVDVSEGAVIYAYHHNSTIAGTLEVQIIGELNKSIKLSDK